MLTVLMSMYNSAAYLELAIRSTLAQSYKNFEFRSRLPSDIKNITSVSASSPTKTGEPAIRSTTPPSALVAIGFSAWTPTT
jgi:hypothetical protein